LKRSSGIEMSQNDISLPEHITYPTSDGQKAHAVLYQPKNSRYAAPEGDRPPLLVLAHGGPTAHKRVFVTHHPILDICRVCGH
jgi:dipeptidyl aminopeptidase/acylaminoacyl peptidase